MAIDPAPAEAGFTLHVSTDPYTTVTATCGRITARAEVIAVGDDLCVVLSGGDRPHIGCVSLSLARPSLTDEAVSSATTSVLNLVGHKDGEAAQRMGHQLAAALRTTVVVTGGIHVDAITPAEIQTVLALVQALTNTLIQTLREHRAS